jgi:MraZ protein
VFYGSYHHRLNTKNQVTVPSRLRDAIDEAKEGKGLYLFVAEPNCLYLFTPLGVQEVVARAQSKWASGQQDFLRMFTSKISPVECDGQGRIVLPAQMKDAVGIGSDVVFVGAHRHVELWSPERWEEYQKQHGADYGQKLDLVVGEVFGL